LHADGSRELQLLPQARAPPSTRRRASRSAGARGAGALSRARIAPARSGAGRSEPGPQQEHSTRPSIVPESVRKPRAGDDRFLEGTSARDAAQLSGRFEIRQLPEAFKPTSPGGFMNSPGVYDQDPTRFYFSPA